MKKRTYELWFTIAYFTSIFTTASTIILFAVGTVINEAFGLNIGIFIAIGILVVALIFGITSCLIGIYYLKKYIKQESEKAKLNDTELIE